MIYSNSQLKTKNGSKQIYLGAINSIHLVHKGFLNGWNKDELNFIPAFDPGLSLSFYKQSNHINQKDYLEWELDYMFQDIGAVIDLWKDSPPEKTSKQTLVHNDFNSRNVGVRKNGEICIYDWELAMINIPQRDIFEFLAFALNDDYQQDRLFKLLQNIVQ